MTIDEIINIEAAKISALSSGKIDKYECNHNFFSTNSFIYGEHLKATAFMVTPKMILNAQTFCF